MATLSPPEVQVIFNPSKMDPVKELIVDALSVHDYDTMFRVAKDEKKLDFVPRVKGIKKEVVYDATHNRFAEAYFLEVHNDEEALGLCSLKTVVNHVDDIEVEFAIPAHDRATRLKWKMVGGCLLKLRETIKKIKATGAVKRYDSDVYALPSRFKEREEVERELKRYKKSRDAGKPPTHDELDYLSSYKPVNLEELQEELDDLQILRGDILYELRKLQLEGLEFDFDIE
jgi:hypothetical protein